MFNFSKLSKSEPKGFNREASIVRALEKTYATIQFEPDGTIVTANENFLKALGYELSEIVGKHHRMFVPEEERKTATYREFWSKIASGETFTDTYCRVRKDGQPIWIEASYKPIYDEAGKLCGAFKLAKDLSDDKRGHAALMRGLTQLSAGDLGARVTEDLSGDYAEMKATFNATVARLSEIVSDISASGTRLTGVADRLSGNASDLSDRAGRLSDAIAGSSETVMTISQSVRSIAEEASQSNAVIGEVSAKSSSGAKVVASSVEAMNSIEDMTNEISNITKVIEGFAFQTNLLSINAAVEAARAGDAGKGFAVVATEVRTLAERSAEASKEIADLISRAQGQVSDGSRLVKEAGEALAVIDSSVTQAVDRIGKISRDTQKQSSDMGALETSLEQMKGETAEVSSMAGSNGRRAADLAGEADALEGSLRFFKQSGGEQGQWTRPQPEPQAGHR